MRAYVVSGPEPGEEAILVFASTAKEARRVGWYHLHGDYEWIDVRARWVREPVSEEYRRPFSEALGAAYVVNPPPCLSCGCWNAEGLGDDGLCLPCAEAESWEDE